MIFLRTRSVFILYGRPSMNLCEKAFPIPGSTSSWSAVALLISTRSADTGAAGFDLVVDFAGVVLFVGVCAIAIDAPRNATSAANRAPVIRFFIMFSPFFNSKESSFLVFSRSAVACLDGVRFGHVLSLFCLPVPARAGLVVYARIRVHPHHARAVRRRGLFRRGRLGSGGGTVR